MHERKRNTEIDDVIDELNQTMNRMKGLSQILAQTDLRMEPPGLGPGVTASLRGLLEALGDDADLLERVVETLNPELYLEWLLSVPADSRVLEYRRTCSEQREEELAD